MSGSLYGMQGLGTTGLGVGSAGAMPGGGQINPQMLAALMAQHGVGTPFQPQGQSPMSALMQHAAPMGGGMGPQPGQAPQVQGPQGFAQASGGGQQGGANPQQALLAQLAQGQSGVDGAPNPLQKLLGTGAGNLSALWQHFNPYGTTGAGQQVVGSSGLMGGGV